MELNKQTSTSEVSKEEALRAKYGKVYRVGITIPVDDTEEQDFSYHFKRPSLASYDRYLKTASNSMTKASKVFLMDNVVEEDRARLAADLEEYPAVGLTIGGKLTELLGLTSDVNLKKL